jgi:hypothetical protein
MDDALAPARALLPAARLDQPTALKDGVRALVHRARATSPDGARSVIVKQHREAGEGWVRECAALATLAPLEVRAPVVLAEGAAPPVVLLDDLGDRPSLATALLARDPDAAADALVAWARALAALHTATRDARERFTAELDARAGDLPVAAATTRTGLDDAVRLLDRELAALGVAVPGGAFTELRALADRLDAGPSALTPGDVCPDNCVGDGAGGFVLIDYEDAQWRPVAWDVACLLVPWPTCWCAWRLTERSARRAVDAYREAAAPAFPAVADDAFAADVEAAAAGWALRTAASMLDGALAGTAPVGPPDRVPPRRATVLNRLEQAARTDAVPLLAELADRLAVELRHRWGADTRLELAPAFRPGGGPA